MPETAESRRLCAALAESVLGRSLVLKRGDRVLVECVGAVCPLLSEVIEAGARHGIGMLVNEKSSEVIWELGRCNDVETVRAQARSAIAQMGEVDAFLGIRELPVHDGEGWPADVSAKMTKHYTGPVHVRYRNANLRWLCVRVPRAASVVNGEYDLPGRNLLRACTINYELFSQVLEPLVARLSPGVEIHVNGPGTDLVFTLADARAWRHVGFHNLPDGEVHTVPVASSVHGTLRTNIPNYYNGCAVRETRFVFENGVVREVMGPDAAFVNAMLAVDDGARRVGEFALGVNPFLDVPVGDLLVDEKMSGSFHIALGNAYHECDNGNRSVLHWDVVVLQRAPFGGSIAVGGEIISKDGLFVASDLEHLNPGTLKARLLEPLLNHEVRE